MANFFDQFDEPETKQANFFDQFDEPEAKQANFFNQFDEPVAAKPEPEPTQVNAAPTSTPTPTPVVAEQTPAPVQEPASAQVAVEPAPTSELAPEFYYDPMTGAAIGNVSSVTPQKQPKLPGSVMAGVNEDLPPAQAPQFDPQVKTLYDAASQQERAKLAQADIRFAEVAKYYQDVDLKNQQYLATNPSRVADPYMADDRLEYRVRDYVQQGMSPEVALSTAKQDALEGRSSHVSTTGEVKEAPEDYLLKRSYALDPKAPGYETALKLAQRTALKSMYGFAQAGGGQQKFLAEAILGVDPSDTNKTLDYISKNTEALGDPTSKPLALVENAVSSIVQQLPGLLTGTQALSLGSMFLQSFGQTYDDSRRKNLGIGESTFRSTAYGALEVLGEKLGLGDTLKGIKAAARGVPDKELIEHFAKSLAKEIPGEQLTYTGQFGVDKAFALNPEAGIKQFLDGAVDTLAATVVQGGIMMGGTAAINKANQTYSDAANTRRAETAAEAAKQNALQKAQDMFKFTPKEKGETPEQQTVTTPPEQTEEVKPLSDQDVIWLEPTEQPAPPEQPAAEQETPVEPTPQQTVPEPYIDPETGEVIEGRVEPTIGSGGNDAVVQRRAAELVSELGFPKNVALAVAQREAAEGGQNVKRTNTESNTGRNEPSISVSEQGAAPTEGVAPSDTTGLAGPVDATESLTGREEAEPTALGEIPRVQVGPNPDSFINTNAQVARDQSDRLGLTGKIESAFARGLTANQVRQELKNDLEVLPQEERSTFVIQVRATLGIPSQESEEGKAEFKTWQADYNNRQIPTLTERAPVAEVVEPEAPAPVPFAELPKAEKDTVTDEAKKLYQSREIVLPIEQSWDNLPEWKHELFAERLYNGGADFANDSDQVYKAREEVANLETNPAVPAATPVEQAQTKLAEAETAVAEATTSEEKKDATKQRNVARQEVKQAQAAAPVVTETTTVETTPEVIKPKRGRPAKPKVEGTEAAAPKPRGRPVKPKTPEEQVQYKADRAAQSKRINQAAGRVTSLINLLSKNVDTTTPAKRKDAIDELNKFATDPDTRRQARSGKIAKEFLAQSNKVTSTERAALANRLSLEKAQIPKPLAAYSQTTSEPVKAFYKFKTAAQVINHIMRNGTPFERALAARLKPFLADVRFAVADADTHPNILKLLEGTDKGVGASGAYSSRRFGDAVHSMIVLRGENIAGKAGQQGVNNVIFLHEALHAATEAKIAEYQKLIEEGKPVPIKLEEMMSELRSTMEAAKAQYEKLKASGAPISPSLRHAFETVGIANFPEEFVAYGLTNPDVQQFLLQAPGGMRQDRAMGFWKNLFSRFVNTMRAAFDMDSTHQSALQDLMLITEGIMQQQEAAPAVTSNTVLNASAAKVDKNLNKIAASNNQQDVIDGIQSNVPAHDFGMYEKLMQARLPAMGNGFVSKSLFTMQTADILRWQGDAIPALRKVDELIERMAGSRLSMEKAFAKKADKLAKFIRYSSRDSRQALSNAMHLARLESVSPTEFADRQDALTKDRRVTELNALLNDPRTNPDELGAITDKRTKREASINKTFDAWDKLGTVKDGQEMYRMVRQFYKDMNLLHRTLLDARIDRLNLSGTVNDPTTPKGKLMLSVRRMYEGSDFVGIEEYFPFMRHGDYWLRVNGPQGREFYMFDNGTNRNAFLLIRAKQIGIDSNDPDAFDAGDNTQELRNKYSGESKILAEMFDVIDQQFDKAKALQASSKTMTAAELQQAETARMNELEQLKDSLYQTYLMTMPEQSYRKQFLHAENVTGFSSDVLRNFKVSATRLAAQAAKLTYGDAINSEVQRGYDTLKGMPALERAKMRLFVDEIDKRVQTELSPPPHDAFATGINQFAYYWLLSGVASAITQTTSLPIMVMPILNDNYGYGKSAVKFAKYMQIWKSVGATEDAPNGDVSWAAPSIGLSKMVQSSPILRRAFDEAVERGITGQTQTSVLTNRNRTPANAYSNIPGAVLRSTAIGMSALFNGAERMTREITYMMTFELEYAKTGDFDKSVQKAIDVVQETLGRYDNFNRPRSLQNFLGRTVGQFKMYAVNMTSFFVRNGYNIFKGIFTGNPKLALSATHRLGGVLTMGALFGGVTGLPLYSTICFVIDAISGEDEEKKRRLKNPITADNADLRFRYDFLRTTFGDVKFTGMDGREHTLAKVLEKGAISELSDINIGSRTSFDGMWWRGGKQGDNMQETVQNYFIANLGPAASTILGMPAAIDDFRKGNILRGVERILPALPKNVFTAARLGSEGAKTPQGNIIMSKKEFSETSLIMQGLGFQSTTLARVQENAYALRREEKSAENSKKDLMARLDDVFLDSNKSAEDKKKFMKEIDKHNKRYQVIPSLTIDADAIFDSIDRSIESMGDKFRGLRIKEEMMPFMLPQRKAAYPGRKAE